MPNVQAPDGSVIAFPDGTTPSVMSNEMEKWWSAQNTPPTPDLAQKDRAPPMQTGSMEEPGLNVSGYLRGETPLFGAQPRGSYGDMGNVGANAVRDLGHNVETGLVRGGTGLLSLIDAPKPGEDQFAALSDKYGLSSPSAMPDHPMRNLEGRAQDAIFNAVPPYFPTTTAGRVTQAAAPGLLGVGAGLRAALYGTLGGAGGELASEASGGSPWATIPATTLPMLLPGGIAARRSSLANAVRARIGDNSSNSPYPFLDRQPGIFAPDWDRAIALETRARDFGVPLMAPEAMDSGPLQRFTSDVRASRGGGPQIDAFLQNRPMQVRAAVNDQVLDPITRQPIQPSQLGPMTQEAASDALAAAEKRRTAASGPLFRAAGTQDLPAATLQPILNNLNARIQGLGNTPARNELVRLRDIIGDENGNVTNTNIGRIQDQNQSFFSRQGYDPAHPSAIDKATAGIVTPHAKAIETALQTNPDFARARYVHEQMTPDVEAARSLPLTDMARTTDPTTQVGTITSRDRDMSGDIRSTFQRMQLANPGAWPGLVRDYFGRAFNAATAPLQSGENPAMGYNFAKAVNGTDAQKANNHAMLEGVARAHGIPASGLALGFDNAMEILDRTARIPGIGSQTAERGNLRQELGRGLGTSLGVLNPLEIPDKIVGALKGAYMSRAYRQFADIITTPDGVQKLRELALLNPASQRAQLIVGELAGLNALASQPNERANGP